MKYYYAQLNPVTFICTGVCELNEEYIHYPDTKEYVEITKEVYDDPSTIGKKYDFDSLKFVIPDEADACHYEAEWVRYTNAGGTARRLDLFLNELFQNVSDGKTLIGDAITDKDPSITIPANPTFQQFATAIAAITTASGIPFAIGKIVDYTFPSTLSANTDFQPRAVLMYNKDTATVNNLNIFAFISAALVNAPAAYGLNLNIYGTGGAIQKRHNIFTVSSTGFSVTNLGNTNEVYWLAIG